MISIRVLITFVAVPVIPRLLPVALTSVIIMHILLTLPLLRENMRHIIAHSIIIDSDTNVEAQIKYK